MAVFWKNLLLESGCFGHGWHALGSNSSILSLFLTVSIIIFIASFFDFGGICLNMIVLFLSFFILYLSPRLLLQYFVTLLLLFLDQMLFWEHQAVYPLGPTGHPFRNGSMHCSLFKTVEANHIVLNNKYGNENIPPRWQTNEKTIILKIWYDQQDKMN